MLKKALQLKDAKVLRCSGLSLSIVKERLKITYHDEEGAELSESFNLSYKQDKALFNQIFAKRLAVKLETSADLVLDSNAKVIAVEQYLPHPDFVIARKHKYNWQVKDRIFDYSGNYRKANQLG
jgi:DNA repair protein RadD